MSKQLTPKEEAFCVAYCTIGNETFSNGTKSAIEAKYAEDSARTQAWRMLRKEHIKSRIRELHKENMAGNKITTDSVLANLAHDRQMARKHNQFHVAKSCTELEGKYMNMFGNTAGEEDRTIIVIRLPEKATDEDETEAEADNESGTVDGEDEPE